MRTSRPMTAAIGSVSVPARAQSPRVLARIALMVLAVAGERGLAAPVLLARAGLAEDAPLAWAQPDATLPLADETRLWLAAAEALGDPGLGLRAARQIRAGQFDVLDYAVRTAPTLREALQRLARYNALVHDVAQFDLQPQGQTLRVVHGFIPGMGQPCAPASEFTLASLVVVAGQLAGSPVWPLAVQFAHPAPADVSLHRAVFGQLPAFGAAASALVFDVAELDRPLPGADPGLSRIVTAHAEQLLAQRPAADLPLAAQVSRQMAERLAQGTPTLAEVAAALHLSERSLQRKLAQAQTCFADLLEQLRRELALRYVADPHLALGEVAYLLGFAEPSPFHRAFRRWTGCTPAEARRRALG